MQEASLWLLERTVQGIIINIINIIIICLRSVHYLPFLKQSLSCCEIDYYLFVCQYWQWPILINCVMCYYLCVLLWLMRPILALCLLQIEQERSEEESSVGDALALVFRCARFCSASLILFASYSPAPLFMRPRHFVRSCAICSHDPVLPLDL